MAVKSQQRHWKNEPLVWMLIAIPLSAVIMGMVILITSINTYSGLVVDDYYKKGKQINRVIARDQLAWELGLEADLQLQPGTVRLVKGPGFSVLEEETIRLDLVHATIPGRDQQLVFTVGKGLETAIDSVGDGRWNVYLHTEDWRLTGSLQRPRQTRITLTPNYQAPVP